MARARGTVSGDRETIANMRRAYNSVGGAFLDRTLRDALEPMKAKTKINAAALRDFTGKYPDFFPQPKSPRSGGHLDQGVVIAKRDQTGRLRRVYWLSFSKRARKLAHLVEFGTAPHFQPNFKGGWHHPGASPRPFFRPAYEQEKQRVINVVAQKAWAQMSGSLIGSMRGRRR